MKESIVGFFQKKFVYVIFLICTLLWSTVTAPRLMRCAPLQNNILYKIILVLENLNKLFVNKIINDTFNFLKKDMKMMKTMNTMIYIAKEELIGTLW